MTIAVVKQRDGYLVAQGRDVLVRGLRERADAFKIRHDLERRGRFRGVVTFARGGVRLELCIPPEHGVDAYFEPPERSGEGTVDDL